MASSAARIDCRSDGRADGASYTGTARSAQNTPEHVAPGRLGLTGWVKGCRSIRPGAPGCSVHLYPDQGAAHRELATRRLGGTVGHAPCVRFRGHHSAASAAADSRSAAPIKPGL